MIIALLVLICLGLIFWFLVLPVLRQKAELSAFFNDWELKQAGFFARLKLGFAGLKSKLWNRFLILSGFLLPILSAIPDFDLASILKPITIPWVDLTVSPTQYVTFIVLPLIGMVSAKLRSWTTAPVGVPTVAQVAAIIPDAPAAVVETKVAEITAVKTEQAA